MPGSHCRACLCGVHPVSSLFAIGTGWTPLAVLCSRGHVAPCIPVVSPATKVSYVPGIQRFPL